MAVADVATERSGNVEMIAHPAVMPDDAEGSDALLTAGKLVYRVRLGLPLAIAGSRTGPSAAAGELHLDVSLGRLRARFVGPGWPVEDVAEVRLRADLLGVYLFDGRGGRSLGSGQLAAWFEGREVGTAQASVGLRREYGPRAQTSIPGELLCAFLAEWGNQERAALQQRCVHGALLSGFRVGPWSGELTAVIPMQLPRRELRADQVDPPKTIAPRSGLSWIEPTALAGLQPSRRAPGLVASPNASLLIQNHSDTRAIILVQGVAVAWVAAGASLSIDGFTSGLYRVGALRPLGVLRVQPRIMPIPGTLTIGSLRASSAQRTVTRGLTPRSAVDVAPERAPF